MIKKERITTTIKKEVIEVTAKYVYACLKATAVKNNYGDPRDFVRHVSNEINRLNNDKGD